MLGGRLGARQEPSEEASHLNERRDDGVLDHLREPVARRLGVRRLAADEPRLLGEHAERAREHERALRRGVVHVGEVVAAAGLAHLRSDHENRSGPAPEVDRVDHDERVEAGEELVDEVDPADPDVDHAHAGRRRLGLEPLRDDDPEAVVSAENVADPCHERAHVPQDTSMDVTAELEARLRRYPADRYPVQRATALFHLGTAVADADPPRARAVLTESVDLFTAAGLEVEAAKARNSLGAALRALGQVEAAAEAFRLAAAAFAPGSPEAGAASFNLGLVLRDADALEQARRTFPPGSRERAAALRELGVLHLEHGLLEEAVAALEEAASGGDRTAANPLGLARLAQGRVDEAIDAFRTVGDAAARANLAVAYERARDHPRARLAARQALAMRDVPEPVRVQAAAVLARLGDVRGDLAAALARELPERRAALARDEVARWAEADPAEVAAEASSLDDDAAEAVLGAVLELPPDRFERLLLRLLPARARLERVTARFHAPQEQRVRQTLARLEEERRTT